MKKRSGFAVMARLIGLVKPLTGYMILAILMGFVGHLCAAFITILGGYAVLDVLGFDTAFSVKTVFVCVLVFALLRAVLRYAEHHIGHRAAGSFLCPHHLPGDDSVPFHRGHEPVHQLFPSGAGAAGACGVPCGRSCNTVSDI